MWWSTFRPPQNAAHAALRGLLLLRRLYLCSDDPSRKLMFQIMGAIAEYDKAVTVLKLRGCPPASEHRPLRGSQALRHTSGDMIGA